MIDMTKEEIQKAYKESLEFLKQAYYDGTDLRNGSVKIELARTAIATYIQIKLWRDMADSVENGANVWAYLDANATAKLSSEIDKAIKE